MNAIKHATQSMIQTPYKPLNIISQHAILSTLIPKHTHTHTHTHTHKTSLNNFYISKNKSRQFSEHTLTHVKPCDGQITLYLHMYQE